MSEANQISILGGAILDLQKRVKALERKLDKPEKIDLLPQTPSLLGFSVDTPIGKRLFRAFGKAGKLEDVYDEYSAFHAEYQQMLGRNG